MSTTSQHTDDSESDEETKRDMYLCSIKRLKRMYPHEDIVVPASDTSLEELKATYERHIVRIKEKENQDVEQQLQLACQLMRKVLDLQQLKN